MIGSITIFTAVLDQLFIALTALGCSILISVPMAVISLYNQPLRVIVTTGANLVQAIPSLAVIAFIVPVLGIGMTPAIIAIMLRATLPIIKNTLIGLSSIDDGMLDAGYGIGLSEFQILVHIRFPMAYPAIFAGIRFSAILANSMVILTAIIGSGGLGTIVFEGLASMNMIKILYGAIPAILIAIGMDLLLAIIEKRVSPQGILE